MAYDKQPWGRAIPYKSPITGRETTLYNIGVLAEALGRKSDTIRKWEISGQLPPTPFRQDGKRLYSKEHIDAVVACAERAKLKNGVSTSSTSFTKWVYEEFQKVNDLFFKEDKSNG